MLFKKRKIIIAGLSVLLTLIITITSVKGAYLPTTRDTSLPPEKVSYDIQSFDEYEFLYETDTLKYYYREDRDIIAIVDKRNDYTWKTGLDIPFSADVTDALNEAETKEEIEKFSKPLEARMNSIYIGIANSLITVEYYDSDTIKTISSASRDGVNSKLMTVDDNPAKRRLDIDFYGIGLSVKVYITLEEDSITYQILDEDISGTAKNKIASINITPFMGASGGKVKFYDDEYGGYIEDQETWEAKYRIPGYIMIPDGCGNLVRMNENSSTFGIYYGNVYGIDPATDTYNNNFLFDSVPLKEPSMPVFGIAHGDKQAAFVAYAENGDEHMQIVVRPDQNMTFYNWAYPRFIYNINYFQIFNKKGEGYFTNMEEAYHLNVKMKYSFLSGDGSDGGYSADYVGMALRYREHLIETGKLHLMNDQSDNVPIRLDFLMTESKRGIIGTDEVVMTTVSDVKEILLKLKNEFNITSINSGLIGWQKKGESLSKPYKTTVSGDVGSKKDFKEMIKELNAASIDVSYARDYSTINRSMMSLNGNAVRHINSWYAEVDRVVVLPESAIETMFGYATPKNSTKWLKKQYEYQKDHVNSMTISGITNILTSSYGRNGVESTVLDTMALYQDTLSTLNKDVKLNLENPNQYLWKYTNRYLQCPVGGSQYLIETDTVPFLQMVLHGTMEVYAPYANFSFYTKSDVLKMIDYNLYPSFILTKEPSYLLANTISAHLYTTEYEQYEKLIDSIYHEINHVLSQVIGYEWSGRDVLENGIIMNTYKRLDSVKHIFINYTDEAYDSGLIIIQPLSAAVAKGGVGQ